MSDWSEHVKQRAGQQAAQPIAQQVEPGKPGRVMEPIFGPEVRARLGLGDAPAGAQGQGRQGQGLGRVKGRRSSGGRGSVQRQMLLTGLAVAAAAVAGIWVWLVPHEVPLVLRNPEVAATALGPLVQAVNMEGTVVPGRQADVFTPFAGTIAAIEVEVGDHVEKGAVLARLDTADLERRLQETEHGVEAAQAKLGRARLEGEAGVADGRRKVAEAQAGLDQAEEQLAVQQRLYAAGAITRKELEDARQAVALAEAKLAAEQEALKLAGSRLDMSVHEQEQELGHAAAQLRQVQAEIARSVLRAPIAGQVVEVTARVGSPVGANTRLFTVVDMSGASVEAKVSQRDLPSLRPGQPAQVTVNGRSFDGQVKQIAPIADATADALNPTVAVEVAILGGEGTASHGAGSGGTASERTGSPTSGSSGTGDTTPLLPNAQASVVVELGRKQALVLPRGPYLLSGQRMWAYVLEEDGHGNTVARKRRVVFGILTDTQVEVLEGLKPGDRVLTGSYDNFLEKDEVLVEEG